MAEILTTAQVAEILRVTPQRVGQLARSGKLLSRRYARFHFFDASAVEEFRRERERECCGDLRVTQPS